MSGHFSHNTQSRSALTSFANGPGYKAIFIARKLVKLGAFTKTGERKGSRYWLNLGPDFEGEKQQHLAVQRIP